MAGWEDLAKGYRDRGGRRPTGSTTARQPVVRFTPSAPRRRKPGGNRTEQMRRSSGGGTRTYGTRDYMAGMDVGDALAEVRAAIGDQFDAEAARLMAEYGGRMAGIGSGAGGAIREAQDVLKDVQANRAALKEVYGQYEKIIDPLAQEALDVAKGLVGEVTPEIEAMARETAEGIAADYAEAEVAISEAASLIGAEGAAARAVQEEASESEAMLQKHAAAEAEDQLKLLRLEGEVATTGALAAEALDEGQMTRRALLQDMSFQGMEEQAQAALAAARRAASAAAARRRSIIGERNAALAELEAEKMAAMSLNPHEAGEVTAINYLRSQGADLDYNRQQLVFNTLSNAISESVPTNQIGPWLRANGLEGALTQKEKNLLIGGSHQYTQGMRHQQSIDRGGGRANTGRSSGGRSSGGGRPSRPAYNWRTGSSG